MAIANTVLLATAWVMIRWLLWFQLTANFIRDWIRFGLDFSTWQTQEIYAALNNVLPYLFSVIISCSIDSIVSFGKCKKFQMVCNGIHIWLTIQSNVNSIIRPRIKETVKADMYSSFANIIGKQRETWHIHNQSQLLDCSLWNENWNGIQIFTKLC